jgi:hypothetical protein
MKFTATKLFLVLVFLLIAQNSFSQAQTSWVKTLFYDTGGLTPYHHDSLHVGPSGYAVRPDGNFFVLNMDYQNSQQTIYLMDSLGNVLNSNQVGSWLTLQEWDCYDIMPTPDSGCVFIEHYFGFGFSPQGLSYSLKKINKSGIMSNIKVWANVGFDYPPALLAIFPSYHNSYYCLLDTNYIEFPSGDTVDVVKLNYVFQNDDLLIADSTFTRRDVTGGIVWSFLNDGYVIVAASEYSVYAVKDSLRKFDSVTGTLLWTKPLNIYGDFCIYHPNDGLASVNQRLVTVLDSSGNLTGQNTINLTYKNPNKIASLPDGSLLTGGLFISGTNWFPDRGYSSFIIKLNSEGHGTIDSTNFYTNTDADNDGALGFIDDAVVVAAAFGHSNGHPDNNSYLIGNFYYTDYTANWSESFQSGINFKYSDINHDGNIDTLDIRQLAKPYGNYSPHHDTSGVIINIVCENTNPLLAIHLYLM